MEAILCSWTFALKNIWLFTFPGTLWLAFFFLWTLANKQSHIFFYSYENENASNMELAGSESVEQVLVITHYVPDVLPYTRNRTMDKTQSLPTCSLYREGDRHAGRSVQHSVFYMVCVRLEIYTACSGRICLRWSMPELNFDGPYLEERETTNFKTIINGVEIWNILFCSQNKRQVLS